MADSSISPQLFPFDSSEDKKPLPLIVAEQWDFSLAYVEEDTYWYSILDWIAGLASSDTNNASKIWNDTQRRNNMETSVPNRSLPYIATDGKTYQRDFTTDKGLYVIAQELRSTKTRTLLKEIKEYLAKAGAFVDLVRREPEKLLNLAELDPDEALYVIIEYYRRRGKPDDWINSRLTGIMKRHAFTAALKVAISDIVQRDYALATNEIYLGLWERTAENLRNELSLKKRDKLRDHQPTLALMYQGLAEQAAAEKLGDQQELTITEALEIIRVIAELIGENARQLGQLLGKDLATGKPLLKA